MKYKPEFCEQLIAYQADGKSVMSFAAHISVGRRTIYEWKQKYPEFEHAMDVAKVKCLAWWEQLGMGAVTGQVPGFQQSIYIYSMKCRFPEFGYNENKQPDDGDASDSNELDTMPTEKLLKLIKR